MGENGVMDEPVNLVINNASNIWVLILVAAIGAVAVLASAFVALKGQRDLHKSDSIRATREDVSEAVSDTINYLGAAGSVVYAVAGKGYSNATMEGILARTNDLYPKALKSITMVVSTPDVEVSRQAEALYKAVVAMSSDIMRKSQTAPPSLAKDFIEHKTKIDDSWNVLLQQTKTTGRMKYGRKTAFMSIEEARKLVDSRG